MTMIRLHSMAIVAALSLAAPAFSQAPATSAVQTPVANTQGDEPPREWTDPQGIRWRETKQVIPRSFTEYEKKEVEQQVLVPKYETKEQVTYQTIQVPVTEYHWEPYLVNRWNPFSQPYIAYRHVPRTRYETKTQEIKTPVVQQTMVPETRKVTIMIPQQRTADAIVISKIPLGPAANNSTDPFSTGSQTAVARKGQVGGQQQLKSDPPRQGPAWGQPALAPSPIYLR